MGSNTEKMQTGPSVTLRADRLLFAGFEEADPVVMAVASRWAGGRTPRSAHDDSRASGVNTTREIHLVDVENLLGTPRFSKADVSHLHGLYAHVSQLAGNAHVVVGSSSAQALIAAGLGWPGARQVWLPGTDGADRALLEVAATEQIASRFERVVIGSGDGIFAAAAASLQIAGCAITVVSRAESLSTRLRLAVGDIRFLPRSSTPASALRAA